jgi:hypothetical protein
MGHTERQTPHGWTLTWPAEGADDVIDSRRDRWGVLGLEPFKTEDTIVGHYSITGRRLKKDRAGEIRVSWLEGHEEPTLVVT